ncbi:hypothetical protein [Streptomyces sp. TE33382]
MATGTALEASTAWVGSTQYRPVSGLRVEATVWVRWTSTPFGPTAAAAWA